MSTQGMAVSYYKADDKEATRNRKRLMAIIKRPENQICADCPAKRAPPPPVRARSRDHPPLRAEVPSWTWAGPVPYVPHADQPWPVRAMARPCTCP